MSVDPHPPRGASRRWARGLVVLRRALVVGLATAGLVVLVTGWLDVCDQQVVAGSVTEVCRAPRIDDGLVLVFGLVLLLMVLPDLTEVGVPGLLSLRREVGQQGARLSAESDRRALLENQVRHLEANLVQSAVSSSQVSSTTTVGTPHVTVNLAGLPAAQLAVPGAEAATSLLGADAALPEPVVQARYAAAEYLLGHLLEQPPGVLGDVRLNLFLPVDDGVRLWPALAPDDEAAEGESWTQGQGVVGRAWQTGEPVSARGADIRHGLETLPADRRSRYERLTVVVAVPVLNAAGRPVGVLSAVSVDPDSPLDADPALDELLTRADVLARVLVDLLGWADDHDSEGRQGSSAGTAPTTSSEGAQWRA
ncbi:MAG: hypothetical protein ACRDYU_04035 [Actinomycetes bacterium]